MKLNEKAFANTSGLLAAVYFVGCYIIASVMPSLYEAVLDSWMHMLNLSGLWKTAPDGFLIGLISFTAVAWVSGWLFAWLYNKLAK